MKRRLVAGERREKGTFDNVLAPTDALSFTLSAILSRILRENHHNSDEHPPFLLPRDSQTRNHVASISTSPPSVPEIRPSQDAVYGDRHMISSLSRIVWRMFSSRRLAMMHDIATPKAIGISTTGFCIASQVQERTRGIWMYSPVLRERGPCSRRMW